MFDNQEYKKLPITAAVGLAIAMRYAVASRSFQVVSTTHLSAAGLFYIVTCFMRDL